MAASGESAPAAVYFHLCLNYRVSDFQPASETEVQHRAESVSELHNMFVQTDGEDLITAAGLSGVLTSCGLNLFQEVLPSERLSLLHIYIMFSPADRGLSVRPGPGAFASH